MQKRDIQCNGRNIGGFDLKIKRFLKGLFLAIIILQPTMALSSKVININCEQTEFQSSKQYLSKKMGYNLGTKNLYLDYSNPNNVIIQTDMGILINDEVIFFEEIGTEISLITAKDHLNYLHHFNLNRGSGEVSVVRFYENDESKREISIFQCSASRNKF